MSMKFRMCHGSLIAFARFCSLCSSFVFLSRAWMAGSSVFSKVMPCLSAVLVARASNFGMARPPSLLLQYNSRLGCSLEGEGLSWNGYGWSGPWLG